MQTNTDRRLDELATLAEILRDSQVDSQEARELEARIAREWLAALKQKGLEV